MLGLQIRIRDPVPILPLDPGFGMGKKSMFVYGMNVFGVTNT
jgi:hypothetical protein